MKKTIPLLLTVTVFVVQICLFTAFANAKKFPEITAEQLNSRIENGEDLLLVNPISNIEYLTKHIPGSVNIPLEKILISEKFPKNKNQLIVTYCLGRDCIYSTDAARLIAKRGYTNIMVFRDGIPGWIKAGFSITSSSATKNTNAKVLEPEQLNAALDNYLVLDIRPASAYTTGYLPESRAIPMAYLAILSVELPKDKSIAVIDHSGRQSSKAAQWLINNGFNDVSIIKGGMKGYMKAGFKLEK